MKQSQVQPNSNTSKPPPEMSITIQPVEQNLVEIFIGQKFHLNMSQLVQKYPDFAAQLKLKPESEQIFEIAHLDPVLFGLIVRHVCSGEKPSKTALKIYAVKMLEIANKYKIDSLKRICDRYLRDCCFYKYIWVTNAKFDVELVLDQLTIALANDAHMLKAECFHAIDLFYDKFKCNKKWLELVESRPSIYRELYNDLHADNQAMFDNISRAILFVIVMLCLLGAGWSIFSVLYD